MITASDNLHVNGGRAVWIRIFGHCAHHTRRSLTLIFLLRQRAQASCSRRRRRAGGAFGLLGSSGSSAFLRFLPATFWWMGGGM